jgi:hypothetical protein
MNLPHSIAIQPNLELKTQPKQLLGSLSLDIAVPILLHWMTVTTCYLKKKNKLNKNALAWRNVSIYQSSFIRFDDSAKKGQNAESFILVNG